MNAPSAVTRGTGIETAPVMAASGTAVAFVQADAVAPPHVAVQAGEQAARVVSGTLPADVPRAQLVEPQAVMVTATDGLPIHAQLFLPPGLKAGERRPALIFSHGGGTLPFLTERFVRLPQINKSLAARVPNGVEHELRRFYYDTAQAAHPYALASLLRLVPVSQVVFGTDFPYRTAADHVKGLTDYGFSPSELRAIDRDNAVGLMPHLGA